MVPVYKQNDLVVVRNLGPKHGSNEYRGIVCGISTALGGKDHIPAMKGLRSYIVQMIDPIPEMDDFTHISITDACLEYLPT